MAKAWAMHSQRNGLNPKDKEAKESWYRAELVKAIGIDSTTNANRVKDFDLCRAHFEAICGDSIEENMEVFKADSKRIIFLIGQICKNHTISDAYVLGTARKITKTPGLNNLHQIEDLGLLHKVRVALIIHAKRKGKEAQSKAAPEPEADPDNCPF